MIRQWIVALFVGCSCSSLAAADDWPQWRGAARDGVWKEDGIVERFADKRTKPAWTVEIGAGYSGPTVADGRVYVTDRQTEPKQIERVLCFDAKSGQQIWKHEYDCPYSISYQAGPRASVTIDDGRAYALGAMGHLHVFDAGTGALLWKKDLNEEYNIEMPIWGIAAAPLIYEDLVILHIGGKDGACIVALDKKDGDEKWKALRDRAQYSAPIVVEQGKTDVVVCWTGDSVAGLNPRTGKVFWRVPMTPRNMPIGISTPVVEGNRLFVTSFYDGSLMLELSDEEPTVKELWRRCGTSERDTDALQSIIATPLFRGDYVYGVDSYGELRCLRADNGDRVWEDLTATPKARWSNIHMVTRGDDVWMFNERGELLIGRVSPKGFTEIDRTKLIDPTEEQLRMRGGVCWSHPAFANRHIFVRNDQELAAFDLSAE
jgi:outer membrane protein assembly factor BamB